MGGRLTDTNFLLRYLMLLGLLVVSYILYAFVYRGNTEPPAKYHATNQNGAVYSLQGQLVALSKEEELTDFAFPERSEEREYGTYIVPGLKYTRTFLAEEGGAPATCTSMTPQGLAVTDSYVLVSAYCHTGRHNSVIYMIDKKTHRFVKEVILPGIPHVGGLAYDPEHRMLWYSSNTNGIAEAVGISESALEAYDYDEVQLPVAVEQMCSLYGIVRDSFMTFYDGSLYVGCFNKFTESVIARYAVDADTGRLVTDLDAELGMDFEMAIPLDYARISEQAQGMAFYQDKLLLSHSFGVLSSRLVFYLQSDERLYVNENSAKSYRLPSRLEQIFVEGDNLYVLFESAAYAYRATSVSVIDRVLKLSLPRMLEEMNGIS